jgi:uncharacterized membrane protein YfcA
VADPTFLQYGLVAAVAFVASVLGGLAGYGTGLLLPLVLVPIVGAEAVVPIIAVSALFSNSSRLVAFRTAFDRRQAVRVAACALPTCLLGAWGYTRLSGSGVAVLLGAVLVALVPLRWMLRRRKGLLTPPGVAAASVGYGLLVGGTTGSGIVLLSILLAAGLEGVAVIATDAGISLALGVVRVLIFSTAGALPPASWVMALLIGAAALPGAFVARRLAAGLSLRLHTRLLDAVVVAGGLAMIAQGLGM